MLNLVCTFVPLLIHVTMKLYSRFNVFFFFLFRVLKDNGRHIVESTSIVTVSFAYLDFLFVVLSLSKHLLPPGAESLLQSLSLCLECWR